MSGVKIYDLRERLPYSLIIEGTPIKVEKFGDELIINLDTGYRIELSAYTLDLIRTALQPNEKEIENHDKAEEASTLFEPGMPEAIEGDPPPFVEPGTWIPEADE